MKKQRNEKPIDEELLMRMMAGEAAGTGEPGTGKGETAVPVEKAQEGKAAETRRRKGRQADYETTFLKGMDIPARYGKPVYVRREYHERIAKISVMLTAARCRSRHTSTTCWRSTSSSTGRRSRRHTPGNWRTSFKKEGGNGMILKLSLTVLLLYYLAVLWKYYRQDIAGIFGTAETDEDTDGTGKEPGQPGEPYTVMGESTYLPFGAEDGEEAAAGAVDEPAAEDDGADYSDIEPEEDEEETDYEPTPEEIRELEEEEELGAYYPDGNPDFATGYSFDDLKKVRRVLVSDNADEKAEREAREVLPSVMGSDIWEAMLDEFEGARERVARLMDNHNV